MTTKKIIIVLVSIMMLIILSNQVMAIANFKVTSFACMPNEVRTTETFTCTTAIQNNGDSTGSLSTVTLYPDDTGWLENANYQVSTSGTVNSGASTEISFTGLKAKKTGNNGFARILLDSVTDTYVSENKITVNSIDVLTTISSTASSATAGATVDVTGRAIAGGNVDTTLTLNINSGGCSIENQAPSATTTGMTNNQQTSKTWTITMGTTTCSYSVDGKVTSRPGALASKTDMTTGSISCSSGCSSDSGSGSSGGGSAAAGGGSSGSSKNATKTKTQEIITSEEAAKEEIAQLIAPTTEELKTQEPQQKTETVKGGLPKWAVPIIFIAIVGVAILLYRKYEL